MPIDPEISLHAAPPSNPLGILGQFATVQNALNQNTMFQQTIAARERAGQILAQAPSMDAALGALRTDPQVGAFYPQILNTMREYQLTSAQVGSQYQKQALDGFHSFVQHIPALAANPQMFDNFEQSALSLAPNAESRRIMGNAIEGLRAGLMNGVQQGGLPRFRQNLYGLMLGSGIEPALLDRVLGTAGKLDLGGQEVTGVNAPVLPNMLMPEGGGRFIPGTELGKTLAPTVVQGPFGAGGAQTATVLGGGGGGGAPAGAAPAAAPAEANMLGATAPGAGQVPTRAPSGPAPALTGPTISQAESYKKTAETAGDVQKMVQGLAETMPVATRRLDSIIGALGQFQAGGGAITREYVARMAQALKGAGLPISQKTIDQIGNSSLGGTQLFQKYIGQFLSTQMAQDVPASATRLREELGAYLNTMRASTDPRALIHILDNIRWQYRNANQMITEFPKYKASGQPVEDFPEWFYSHIAGQQSRPATTPWGSPLTAIPAKDIKGLNAERAAAGGRAPIKSIITFRPKGK